MQDLCQIYPRVGTTGTYPSDSNKNTIRKYFTGYHSTKLPHIKFIVALFYSLLNYLSNLSNFI